MSGSSATSPWTPQSVTPSVIVVGGINWRFADPAADGLIGFNFGKLTGSLLARSLVTQMTANQGLAGSEVKKIFDGLSGVDQVVLSVRENQVVAIVTGSRADSKLPALDKGWKAVPVVGNAMLIGNAEAVDQAVQRIGSEAQLGDLARLGAERQVNSDFWAVGSGTLAGPQAVDAGLKRFSLIAWVQERVTSEVAFEFSEIKDVKALPKWATALDGVRVDGNVIFGRLSMETGEVSQFAQFSGSPLGQRLGGLMQTARNLPIRDASAAVRSKPVIYGLDDGPREVKQYK